MMDSCLGLLGGRLSAWGQGWVPASARTTEGERDGVIFYGISSYGLDKGSGVW